MKALWSLLEQLELPSGSLVYLHTSFRRMRHLADSPAGFLEDLLTYLGPQATLVCPSFSWNLEPQGRPWSGYQEYFDTRPDFDVRTTPANIGVIPELFRQRPGVRRSLNYWWSVAALGPMAEEITADQLSEPHPYAPSSSFGKIHQNGGHILGLGVTLNTTSLAFVPDHALGNSAHLTPDLRVGRVRDERGQAHLTRSYWVLPQAVQQVKPAQVFSSGLTPWLRRRDHGEVIQFCYRYADYHQQALVAGRLCLEQGLPFPWWQQCPVLCQPGSGRAPLQALESP